MIPEYFAGRVNACACGARAKTLDLESTSSIPKKEPMMWRVRCHACGKSGAAMMHVDKAITAWNMVNSLVIPT